jgi:23S rRNA-/tRNA-specific pseudouridylate synthase
MHTSASLRWLSRGLAVSVASGLGLANVASRLALGSTTLRQLSIKMAETESSEPYIFNEIVQILESAENHVVVCKPPSVVCHHNDWSKAKSSKRDEPEVPMLQRTREAIGERVNLVHRLDRGASGCLLFARASSDEGSLNATATLQQAMTEATKTYVALVRGEGIFKGRDFTQEGWFEVTRPIKGESGKIKNATTYFRFVAGQDDGNGTRPRASLVLARPKTGRWHQIRKHLNGLSHPILGDSTHGVSKVNREWRANMGMLPERICLHLLQLELPPSSVCPNGIRVASPLAPDMMELLEKYLPGVLQQATPILKKESLELIPSQENSTFVPIQLVC